MAQLTDRQELIDLSKKAAKDLRLECIRAGFVQPRAGDPDEKKIWDEGEASRRKPR